ncbi:MAG TPA: HlyD family secretion protein [Elusimicrobiota bacterium]|nr:HlyD family secretion protein [Elusimicrobiota bacterium]
MADEPRDEEVRRLKAEVRRLQEEKGAKSKPRSPWRKPLVIGAAVLILLGGLAWWLHARRYEGTDDAYVDGHVSAVAARVAGTITGVYFEENQAVKAGQRLASLDPRDFEAAVLSAQRDLDAARARVAQSEANALKARRDKARTLPLVAKDEVSLQQSDAVVAAATASSATLAADRASAAAAAAQLEEARLNLSYCEIVAPVDGLVAKRIGEVGFHTTPGEQLALITRTDDLWVTANFRETQLRKMRVGQRARVHVDALGRTFGGWVESLPAASGAVTSVLPPENATGNFVKVVQRLPVRIRLDAGQKDLDRLRPGMSVEPKVKLDSRGD